MPDHPVKIRKLQHPLSNLRKDSQLELTALTKNHCLLYQKFQRQDSHRKGESLLFVQKKFSQRLLAKITTLTRSFRTRNKLEICKRSFKEHQMLSLLYKN